MRLLTIVFFVCVFLLGVIKIEDTDTWTHLSLGREIANHRGFPDNELFTFPSLDKPFYNPEWLFDLIFYIAYTFFDVYGAILLKAFIITAVFFIILKDSFVPYKNPIISTAVLTLIIFTVRHRFVERPDIILMLFLSFAVFSLNSFVHENKKYIYFLPLTQILWVNMHPSIVLVVIPFGIFIFGGMLQRLINKKYNLTLPFTPSLSQLKVIGIIFFLVLVASLINPYFHKPFLEPFKLTTADWFMDEITELQPPTWEQFKSPYLLTIAIVISFIFNISLVRKPKLGFLKRLSIIHLFLVIPFVYSSFTSIRFIFLLGIIAGPIIARNIAPQFVFDSPQSTTKKKKIIVVCFLIAGITLFTALAISGIKPFSNPNKVFGFGINYNFFPESALRYLDKRKITGRIFNTYQWGGYITWRDFPKRSAFVDGRGYLPIDLLEVLDLARIKPSELEKLRKKYNFDIAILDYPSTITSAAELSPERDFSLSSKDWALVYWDDLSLVYFKRNEKLGNIIEKDEYRYVIPSGGPSAIKSKLHDGEYLSGTINDLKRNINETNSSIGHAFLGFIYNEMGLYREAITSLSMVKETPFNNNLFNAYQGLAFAYSKLSFYYESIKYYKKALRLKKEADILYNIGIIYIQKGNEKKGAEYLEDALKVNKNLISIYPMLISIYQKYNELDKLKKITDMYENAKTYGEAELHFKKGVKAYIEQKYELAVEEYKKSIEANPINPTAYSNLGYCYYDIGMYDKAFVYLQKAIELDPNFANAHYGLALTYKKMGDSARAKNHWEEYLRIEPKGYFSRKAKEELRRP